jgi:hypothetical protein
MGHFALLTTQKCRHHTKLSTTAASLVLLGLVAVSTSTDCRTRDYQGIGYRYSPPDDWGNILPWNSLDILEVQVGGNETVTENFQVVVPAVSSAPLAVGARLK